MTKYFHFLLVALIAIVLGCSKSDPENPDPQPQPQETITFSPGTNTTPVLGTTGGSVSVTFTTSASWSASVINTRASDWCSVSPTSGGAGTATITITASENTTPDNRAASVTIKSGNATQTIKVEQKQKDALTVSQSSFEVPAAGQEIKVVAKANVSFTYTISEDARTWIKPVGTKALKESVLTFEISANSDLEHRTGEIYLSSGNLKDTVKVYQAGAVPSIVISQEEYVLKSEGESFEVEVASNVDAIMNIVFPDGTQPWFAENKTKAMSTNKYVFTAQANEAYDSRSAMIIFANVENNLSDTVRVIQMQKDAIVLAKSEYEFGNEGGELDFEVQTNVDIAVSISDNSSSWIRQVETRALETKKLHFNISACDTLTNNREGYITLSGGNASQTIKVTQTGLNQILEAERQALIAFYKAAGGDNWKNNTNWCSDKPVEEWYGVGSGDFRVTSIDMPDNNLSGTLDDWLNALLPLKELEIIVFTYLNLGGSIPETIGYFPKMRGIHLYDNNLTGELPKSISNLTKLEALMLGNNHLTGTLDNLPLDNLVTLEVFNNEFEGNLPEFGDRVRVFDLSNNNFTGGIPESHIKAFEKNNKGDYGEYDTEYGCRYFVNFNKLSGTIPSIFTQHRNWMVHWYNMVPQKEGYGFDRADLPAFNNTVKCYDSTMLSLKEEYAKNKYTLIFRWGPDCLPSQQLKVPIYELYSHYKDKGLGLLVTTLFEYSSEATASLTSVMPDVKFFWENFQGSYNNNPYDIYSTKWFLFRYGVTPSFYVVDNNGNIVYLGASPGPDPEHPLVAYPNTFEQYHHDVSDIFNYVANLFGDEEFVPSDTPPYMSTDFSKDGTVVTLQKAKEGKGINLVLMGDGYTDEQIASGMYRQDMERMYNALFKEEPYKSHKDLFSVHYVNVVSLTSGYDYNYTALKGWFGDGTTVGGDDAKCIEYAMNAISDWQMDDATIIVAMNAYSVSGTCYMYSPANNQSTWGSGLSISYFTKGDGVSTSIEQLLHHEACGHGFAKLADEYAYEALGAIPEDTKQQYKILENYGWWKNVDFTNDKTQVKWAKFLADSRYQYDGLGVFEGGMTYWSGVWRPTDNSIMRYNVGGFNAPSREAIYYRIHKLAYGPEWEYDYEKFVEYDAINRKTQAQSQSMPLVLKYQDNFVSTPPVVIPHSWREAVKSK